MQENQTTTTETQSSSDSVVAPAAVPAIDQQPKTNEIQLRYSFLVILLSVLLFISVSVAGFFAFQTQKLVKELQVTSDKLKQTAAATTEPTIEPVATISSEVDPTANWKTFTSSKYGFSFKYPSNFEDIGSVAGPYSIKSSESVGIRSFSDPLTIREGDAPFDGFSLYYVDNLNAQSFDEFLVNEKTTMDNAAYASMTGSKRISLNNNGVAYINETRGYYYYPLEGGTKSLVFAYIENNPNFRIVFNQILSTFKFIN